jgi:choline dehydrogenase
VGWSWNDVLVYFKKSEDYMHGPDEFHGAGGPLRVEDPRMRWTVLDDLQEAAAQSGLPNNADFNRGENEGCGYLQVTQRRGRRCSTAQAFLRAALKRRNLTLLTQAQAARIRILDGRATGVEFLLGENYRRSAEAKGEIIVAAGAYASPQLLQLSGIGPESLLRQHGLTVHRDLPGVGENLQDHINARFVQKLARGDTMNTRFHNPFSKALMGVEYFLFRRGPMTSGVPPLSGFARSDPSRETPNVQFHATTASYENLGEGPHRFPVLAGGICNLRPRSRGNVRIKSIDPFTHPALLHNYLVHEDDQRVAIDSLRLMRRIIAAPALARYEPEDYMPSKECQTDEELLEQIRAKAWTAFHPVGTCKMGQGAMAVVDERLCVHGIIGLRVIDASIMPTLVSGNTNAPTIMIAEKGAQMIKEDRRATVRTAA